MTLLVECWLDSAPEMWDGVPDPLGQQDRPASGKLGPFSGITTNPRLLLEACQRSVPGCDGSGWDLYLACGARSAGYLRSRQISVPLCVQLDPRAAFDTATMLRQATQIRELIPEATIKVPMTMAGIETIRLLVPTGAAINATWGFSVAQLLAAAQAIEDGYRGMPPGSVRPRHVLTLMEGRIGDLGLSPHFGDDTKAIRAAECLIFEAAYGTLRRYRDCATLLASSLRAGPGDQCWHFGTKVGLDVIVTLPPSFLRQQGLPMRDVDYGSVDDESRARAASNDIVRRYTAEDGFEPPEFDRLPPLIKTCEEVTSAMGSFDRLACHG